MKKSQSEEWPNCLILLVGAAGFELATPCTPCKCATRLRHAPTNFKLYQRHDALTDATSNQVI